MSSIVIGVFFLVACLVFALVLYPNKNISSRTRWPTIIGAGIVCLAIYIVAGRPGLPGYRHSDIVKALDQQLLTDHDIDSAQIRESIRLMEEKLRRAPNDPKSWIILGRAWALLSQPGEALFAFERGLEHAPNDDDLRKEYARSLAFVNDPRALGLLSELLEERPDNPDILWTLATYTTNLKQFSLALSYWERLRDILPPNSPERNTLDAYIEDLERATAKAPPLDDVPASQAPSDRDVSP